MFHLHVASLVHSVIFFVGCPSSDGYKGKITIFIIKIISRMFLWFYFKRTKVKSVGMHSIAQTKANKKPITKRIFVDSKSLLYQQYSLVHCVLLTLKTFFLIKNTSINSRLAVNWQNNRMTLKKIPFLVFWCIRFYICWYEKLNLKIDSLKFVR